MGEVDWNLEASGGGGVGDGQGGLIISGVPVPRQGLLGSKVVDQTGLKPATSSLRTKRSIR